MFKAECMSPIIFDYRQHETLKPWAKFKQQANWTVKMLIKYPM